MSNQKALTLIATVERLRPDFTYPEEEQVFAELYLEAHDALLNLEGLRAVGDESALAYARALLMQRGMDEALLPWELCVSYNLRLAEYVERLVKTNY